MLRAWLSVGRGYDEFWRLSPAQTFFALEAQGATRKKGKVADFIAAARAAGKVDEG